MEDVERTSAEHIARERVQDANIDLLREARGIQDALVEVRNKVLAKFDDLEDGDSGSLPCPPDMLSDLERMNAEFNEEFKVLEASGCFDYPKGDATTVELTVNVQSDTIEIKAEPTSSGQKKKKRRKRKKKKKKKYFSCCCVYS